MTTIIEQTPETNEMDNIIDAHRAQMEVEVRQAMMRKVKNTAIKFGVATALLVGVVYVTNRLEASANAQESEEEPEESEEENN